MSKRDLVEQLRFQHVRVDIQGSWLDAKTALPIARKAAREIERLRAKLKAQKDNKK